MEDATYPSHMKIAKILALFKKTPIHMQKTIGRLAFCQVWIKYLRKLFIKGSYIS